MTTVIVYLAPINIHAEFYFDRDAARNTIASNFQDYQKVYETHTSLTGEDAAEEMFDLTNNPSRQNERHSTYGLGRSLSSGDVVSVDGTRYACLSMGWEIF